MALLVTSRVRHVEIQAGANFVGFIQPCMLRATVEALLPRTRLAGKRDYLGTQSWYKRARAERWLACLRPRPTSVGRPATTTYRSLPQTTVTYRNLPCQLG